MILAGQDVDAALGSGLEWEEGPDAYGYLDVGGHDDVLIRVGFYMPMQTRFDLVPPAPLLLDHCCNLQERISLLFDEHIMSEIWILA